MHGLVLRGSYDPIHTPSHWWSRIGRAGPPLITLALDVDQLRLKRAHEVHTSDMISCEVTKYTFTYRNLGYSVAMIELF